jgi:hypothetical protein
VADVEENTIIRDRSFRIDERRRQLYDPGCADSGWLLVILGFIVLAV